MLSRAVYLIVNSNSGVERQVILIANNTLVTTSHFPTLSCFLNCELHLRCGAAGDPNSRQHAGDDEPLPYFVLFY